MAVAAFVGEEVASTGCARKTQCLHPDKPMMFACADPGLVSCLLLLYRSCRLPYTTKQVQIHVSEPFQTPSRIARVATAEDKFSQACDTSCRFYSLSLPCSASSFPFSQPSRFQALWSIATRSLEFQWCFEFGPMSAISVASRVHSQNEAGKPVLEV